VVADSDVLVWIAESVERTADVAGRVGPDVEITGCPGWTMADLVAHVAPTLHGWYAYNLTRSVDEHDSAAAFASAPPTPTGHDDRIHYLREGGAAFLARASEVDLDAPTWGFGSAAPARLWLLRAATEMAVHCWDAELAANDVQRVTPDRAATAVEETMRYMYPALVHLGAVAPERFRTHVVPMDPIGVRIADAGTSIRLANDDGEIVVTLTTALPATVVTGAGHDVMLYQWGRIPIDQVNVSGDRELVEAWNFCSRVYP
jgi:uncharacterized protein (TIGR03083 family)